MLFGFQGILLCPLKVVYMVPACLTSFCTKGRHLVMCCMIQNNAESRCDECFKVNLLILIVCGLWC